MMDAILTQYPLSRAFAERLGRLLGSEPLRMSIAELRQKPVVQMIRYLRSLRIESLYLPVEDENAAPLLPVLKLLAFIVPARAIFVVDGALAPQRVSFFDILVSISRLVGATVAALWATLRAKREVTALLFAPRIPRIRSGKTDVLFLNANLWFGVKAGGSVGHISGVVNGFVEKGRKVDFASAGGRLLVKDGAVYARLVPSSSFGFPWELNYYRFHFSVVRQVLRIVARREYAFIYQRMSLANYSGVVLSRKLGLPLILEYNGSEAWVAKNWGTPLREQRLAEQVEDVCLRHAHLVVTISDALRDDLLARGVVAERIVCYPNCIDPQMFDPTRFDRGAIRQLRARHRIPEDCCVITFVGTFGQWHGVEILAKAARLLLEEDPAWIAEHKIVFLFVGDGIKMPEVRITLGEHEGKGHVVLAGLVPQNEAPLYLAASDVLVSPHVPNADGSRFFGSPTKLFEYMVMGKPIVASSLDQIEDVLKPALHVDVCGRHAALEAVDQERAVMCVPGSVDSLMHGLRAIMRNPIARKKMGDNARLLALERYTWSKHVAAIIDGFVKAPE